MNLFSEDSLFGQIFGFLGQLILLNILWIVTSIPVVTAGASTTAMYYVVLKLHKEGEISVGKAFFQSFKQNFAQATAVWLVFSAMGILLFLGGRQFLLSGNTLFALLACAVVGLGIFMGVLLLYIFPVIAAFSNTSLRLVAGAFYFALHKPWYLLITAALTCLPMYFTMVDAKLFPVYLLIWLMCGFSLTAYGNAWFYLWLFMPHLCTKAAEESSRP